MEMFIFFFIVLVVVDLHNRFKVIGEFEIEGLSIFLDTGLSLFKTYDVMGSGLLEELDEFDLGL